MAIIKPNNNTLSAVTALPAAIPTGKVLQVSSIVSGAVNQNISSSSPNYIDLTNMTLNITPATSSSKIVVLVNIGALFQDGRGFGIRIIRGSTTVFERPTYTVLSAADGSQYSGTHFSYIDSPNTASQVTYKVACATHDGNQITFNASYLSNMYLMEIGA